MAKRSPFTLPHGEDGVICENLTKIFKVLSENQTHGTCMGFKCN